jgi:hypothetical protein
MYGLFLTYSVYSLNFSNRFPQQSEYLMMVTLYFLLSISWTLLSMIWFIIENHFTTKKEMIKPLYILAGFLQNVFSCCFPPSKSDEKTEETDEDEQFDKPDVMYIQNSQQRNQRSIPLQSIFTRSIQTNEKITSKCDFCNRRKSCQQDFDKDKQKDKKKKSLSAQSLWD